MKDNGVHIKDVLPESIAHELGIEKGDRLITINGVHIKDILEYKFLTTDEFLELEIEKPSGEPWILELEKEYDEDIGIVFEGIIDKPRSCHNKCIFCFIDQLPKNMRETLYFKDDDTRLSFLQGNFVSMTNLNVEDINRIIRYRISPINVSVHTTDPELRARMLNNKNAGRIMEYLTKLKSNGIQIKAQIVLCPDINDRENLSKTIADLSEFYSELSCVAVVPVGLTKYRDDLYELKEYDKDSASKVIEQVESMQNHYLKKLGTRFVFLSDEFYIISQKELPEYEKYEGFPQLENGVGIISLFECEIDETLKDIDTYITEDNKNIFLVTGKYAEEYINKAVLKIKQKMNNINISVIAVENNFFGTGVKVSGLLTGTDIINQVKPQLKDSDNIILIPDNMLRDGENIFLDDITLEELQDNLNSSVLVCKEDGSDLIQKIIDLWRC